MLVFVFLGRVYLFLSRMLSQICNSLELSVQDWESTTMKLSQEHMKCRAALANADGDVLSIRTALNSSRTMLEQMQRALSEKDEEVGDLRSTLEEKTEEARGLQSRADSLAKELEEIKKRPGRLGRSEKVVSVGEDLEGDVAVHYLSAEPASFSVPESSGDDMQETGHLLKTWGVEADNAIKACSALEGATKDLGEAVEMIEAERHEHMATLVRERKLEAALERVQQAWRLEREERGAVTLRSEVEFQSACETVDSIVSRLESDLDDILMGQNELRRAEFQAIQAKNDAEKARASLISAIEAHDAEMSQLQETVGALEEVCAALEPPVQVRAAQC
jgi:DNA repair exonuclease SbcCD ATPase subunit